MEHCYQLSIVMHTLLNQIRFFSVGVHTGTPRFFLLRTGVNYEFQIYVASLIEGIKEKSHQLSIMTSKVSYQGKKKEPFSFF